MPLTPEAIQRTEILDYVGRAYGILRSAVGNVNIGETLEECKHPRQQGCKIAKGQIKAIKEKLDQLELLLRGQD